MPRVRADEPVSRRARRSNAEAQSRRPAGLILVAVPIGDPDDITVRALRTLRSVSLIAAEDLREARRLLAAHAIETPTVRYTSTGEINEALASGRTIALIVDAGTPGIADPGAALVRRAIALGVEVTAMPGPVAAILALVISGLPTGRFAFDGFPPRSRADRKSFFRALASERRTIVLYESASHLPSTLTALETALGPERGVAIARNLTLPHEVTLRGSLADLRLEIGRPAPRGRYTLVIVGNGQTDTRD